MRLTQDLVDKGDVTVEVYPMVTDADYSRIASDCEVPEFYDVVVRPSHDGVFSDGVFSDGTLDPFLEFENKTLQQANDAVRHLTALYPGLTVKWI
jgi:hypothetical protein